MEIKSFRKAVEVVKKFLSSQEMEKEIFFGDGFFLKVRKIISDGSQKLEIHTSGYDGTLDVIEAIEWIKWTLFDYKANGILV